MNIYIKNIGSTDEILFNINSMLKKLGYKISEVTNVFTAETKLAIESVQNDLGLVVNGIVDKKTYDELLKLYLFRFPNDVVTKNENTYKQVTEKPTTVISAIDVKNEKPILKRGNTGDFVYYLQEKLKEYGMYSGKIDGNFGIITEMAVKKFQTKVELKADGIVGKNTWSRLENYSPAQLYGYPKLQQGDNGEYVRYLQEKLKEFGMYKGEIDGKFGFKTYDAVKQFQDKNKLKVDGIVGSNTWQQLEIYKPEKTITQKLENNDAYPVLRPGDKGEEVSFLQTKLKEFGFFSGLVNGVFGPILNDAVKNFQKETGLKSDGIVEKNTWYQLENYSNTRNISNAFPILRQGDIGEYVLYLQTKLKEYGFFSGLIDGKFGIMTTDAVKKFQKAVGLKVDGIVGKDSWDKIEKYSNIGVVTTTNTKPTIRQGDSGEYVTYLQTKLKEYGFYTGAVDGKFGAGTTDAVKRFQSSVGLTPDGVVGTSTWNAIDNYGNEIGPGTSKPTIRQGDSGEYVTYLQTKLKEYGFYTGVIDGKFGAGTTDAVKRFQSSVGLTADGVVGKSTWDAIDNYTGVIGPGTPKPTIRQGDSGEYVIYLQTKLKEYGFYTGVIDGKFGASTTDAVKRFQSSVGLTADGVVGKSTWDAIDNYTGVIGPGTPKPTIRQGDSGEYVIYLQTKLKEYGFYTGAVDGKFGASTTDAVKRFQSSVGLTADGVVGKSTWDAIDNYTGVIGPGTPKPTIRQGDSGDYVSYLQIKLLEYGFYTGAVDGKFGAGTTAAVKKFQSSVGLTADGVVGKSTWDAIDNYDGGIGPGTPKPTIRQGDSGEYVIYLQTKLKEYGFYTGAVDGKFGAGTTDAVKRFQSSVGLTADGVVGKSTWDAIDNYINLPTGTYPTLREGDSGDYVTLLQERLTEFGYYKGPIDGHFGPSTTQSVKNFQRDKGLTADGVVGTSTWEAILNHEVDPSDYPTIQLGSTGDYVRILQSRLKELGYYYGTVTGSFDIETQNAVIAFQIDNELTPNGIVDSKTWYALFESQIPPDILPGGPKPTLRYGDTGEYVVLLQQELKKLLYYDGPINGIFDNKTLIAVKAFQSGNKLSPDGVVGRSTWSALIALYPPVVQCF